MTANTLRVGIHTSIAGGLPKAVESAAAKGCDGFQIFARNPRGWTARGLERDEVRAFREARERANLWPLAIHSVYLINLASQDPVGLERSRRAFREEIERGLELGADYLVVHPGNPVSAPADVGIVTAAESIREATRGLSLRGASTGAGGAGRPDGLTILIENTAGQGSSIGCHFEQVADMLAMLDGLPVGVCLDTAHTLAAGYDIATAKGLKATMRLIERSFGFERIRLIHCNDSKVPLGSRVDRHQHIGEGHIGGEGFRRLTHTLKFRRIPFILETPVDRERDDVWNINRLRELGA
ncbi:MAG TPA: deoxyribonuclease IV [Blastocatellia bacterium]|nr:deoxyribonuclease IV [Blastocatellia bacterium]